MSNMSTHSRATSTGDSNLLSGGRNRRHMTYTALLDRLSQTPPQPELYSRVQYQPLARFLSNTPKSSSEAGGGASVYVPRPAGPTGDSFIHVVVHTFCDGVPLERQDFDLKDGLARFADYPQPEANADQIIFVRGSLSPAWIEAIGTRYKIDPEFFRRHLRYLPGRDYWDLPSLPSANTEIITLRLASLYTRTYTLDPGQVRRYRETDSDVARRNQQIISAEMACGETVIRRFSTLSDRLSSVEHEISIFTRSRKSGGRIAVVLLDNGREMNKERGPPCFTSQDHAASKASVTGISPIPIIIPRPPTLGINVPHPQAPRDDDPTAPNSISHVASRLPFYFGMSINLRATPTDPLALICEVFRLVVGSECQYLNRLRHLVQDIELDPENEKDIRVAIDTVRHIKELLEDHQQCLKQNIAFLKTRTMVAIDEVGPPVGNTSTPAKQSKPPCELRSILIDFTELLYRAESLDNFCTETMGLILNAAMLRESQKAIKRADDQRRLTVLAYLFLPLTLVFSLFGMNVKELGQGSQSIWLPFAVLAPVAGISWILFSPSQLQRSITVGVRLLNGLK